MEYYKQSIGDVVKEFNSNAKDGLHADIIPFSITCIFLIVYIPIFNLYFHTAPLHATDWISPFASWALPYDL
jgi:hypothetical protein